jgi:hypothetical protein
LAIKRKSLTCRFVSRIGPKQGLFSGLLEALPAEPMTVALYLAALAEARKPSTIRRRMDSISVVHQLAGFASSTTDAAVQAVWKGIRRTAGIAPAKKKAARTKVITAFVAPLGTSLGDVRDRALLLPLQSRPGSSRRNPRPALWQQAGNLPGPGLASLASGIGPHRRRGVSRGEPSWAAEHEEVERSSGGRHGKASGSANRLTGDFAGHSLRAGFATEAYAQGTPELAIMRHGRWRSASVMCGYVEQGGVWNDNAAQRLGL